MEWDEIGWDSIAIGKLVSEIWCNVSVIEKVYKGPGLQAELSFTLH